MLKMLLDALDDKFKSLAKSLQQRNYILMIARFNTYIQVLDWVNDADNESNVIQNIIKVGADVESGYEVWYWRKAI